MKNMRRELNLILKINNETLKKQSPNIFRKHRLSLWHYPDHDIVLPPLTDVSVVFGIDESCGRGIDCMFYDEMPYMVDSWRQIIIDEAIEATKRYDFIHTFIQLILGSTGIIIIDSLHPKPFIDWSILEKDHTDYRIISYKELYEKRIAGWYGVYSISGYPSYTLYSSYDKYIDKGQSNKPKINNRGKVKK